MKRIILIPIIFLCSSIFFVLNLQAQGFKENTESLVSLSDYDVLIYPNPVTDNKFFVKSVRVIKSIEVNNVLGENIKTVKNNIDVSFNIHIDLGKIQKGMYMVRITFDDKKTVIHKLIVK